MSMREIIWKLRDRLESLLTSLGLSLPGKVMYIGGSDTLPAPLEREAEAELIARLERGDRGARDLLIEHNLRLVAYIARRFENTGINIEDLISIGTIGLIKAVGTYQPAKSIKLATYASRCIENEILMHFRTCRKQGDAISMAEPIDTDKDGNQLTLLDIIEDGCDIQEQVASQMQIQQLYQFLQQKLTPREVEILVHRYGLYGQIPMTQREVAKKMGISRSYVSRLEKRAIAMLRKQYDQTPFSSF